MGKLLVLAVVLLAPLNSGAATPAAGATPPPYALFDAFKPINRIDELVLTCLRAKGIAPSELCSDEVFLRRVYLDVIGTLPSPEEARGFLSDQRPQKRAILIDTLLSRGEFADYWGLKWGDLLRVKSEFPSNLWPNAVQAYDRWIRESLRQNKPYDQFVRELLTSSGSNFRTPPVNFYRAFQERSPRQIAENVALVFMGLRLNDAGFSDEQIMGFSAFFSKVGYKNTDEWKEEIVFFNPKGQLLSPATGKAVLPRTLDGKALEIPADKDPRGAFADWLTAPTNPWFARSIANRIWFWLTSRGIVHEPDNMKRGNEPWCPELLAYLEAELVKSKYDLKHIFALILNSRTYQLSSIPNQWNAADESGCSHYLLRRLEAEPLLDAINQITVSGEKYTSSIPEPFSYLPSDERAIILPDGSIESSFLEMFGRPPRNTSFESERVSSPSMFQAQHMLNSSHIQKKIEQSKILQHMSVKTPKNNPIEDLYIRILSRFPTVDEKQAAQNYLNSSKRKSNESFCDLAWALINSKEFMLKH